MEAEHCSKEGCSERFVKSNVNTTPEEKWLYTCPKDEWEYVVGGKPCPDMGLNRRIPDIPSLMTHETVVKAKLTQEEVIAVVLYTGPMFKVYNCILRHYPEDLFERFDNVHKNNFSATIFVLASSVQKLSRTTPLPDGLVLYRGLGGTSDLPESFFQTDDLGCTGFAEWGFMSTTSEKSVALQKYSGLKQGSHWATVLVIQVGAVDRGACVRDLSQYPIENEYLWLPCCWVEQRGEVCYEVTLGDGAHGGLVRMIPCSVRANIRFTTEQLLDHKKEMHLAAFRHLIDDLRRRLHDEALSHDAERRLGNDRTKFQDRNNVKQKKVQWSVQGLLDKIVAQSEEVLCQHERVEASHYADEGRFRGLMVAMSETVYMAMSKLQYWLEDSDNPICFLHDKDLRVAHRERVSYLWRNLPKHGEERRLKAEALCKVRGLIEMTVNERNELGETRLMAAAADGRSPADLRLLAAAGADVNLTDPQKSTALHGAAVGGHVKCIKALVALHANLDVQDDKERTPLFQAAKNGHAECVRALLEARADVTLRNDVKATAVFVAAQGGHAGCIVALAENGADVNTPNAREVAPLWMAVQEGRIECVRALLEFGANGRVVCRSKSALQLAKEKAQDGKNPAFRRCLEELQIYLGQTEGAAASTEPATSSSP